jgi:hypothetical protein
MLKISHKLLTNKVNSAYIAKHTHTLLLVYFFLVSLTPPSQLCTLGKVGSKGGWFLALFNDAFSIALYRSHELL